MSNQEGHYSTRFVDTGDGSGYIIMEWWPVNWTGTVSAGARVLSYRSAQLLSANILVSLELASRAEATQ